MHKLYEKIAEYEESRQAQVLTVLEGECFGEKALLADGELVWESKPNGFFSARREVLSRRASTGKLLVEGTLVFCDCLSRQKELVICGGGHVSMPLVQLGRMTGFSVTVLEDRPYFADMARSKNADRVICDSFVHGLSRIEGGEDTYFVIVTRGHRHDKVCLEEILKKEWAYAGMMASRGRAETVKKELLAQGFSEEKVEKLRSPVGLSIRAETPAEIAVSVMAEIIEVKNKGQRRGSYSKEITEAILDTESREETKALATIVSRKGSAPRAVGTKMLVLSDGRTKGTIGGGCMEAEVIREALLLIREGKGTKLCRVDMTGADAEEEGMACGGTIDVLLEPVN